MNVFALKKMAESDRYSSHTRFYLFRDLWGFMKERKKWWLLPILITLFLVGILIIFGQSSPLSPFIYALF